MNFPMNFDSQRSRLHSLDVLRTVAAFAVVLAHWPQHFFAVAQFSRPIQDAPFYKILAGGYLNGPTAVTFFFCLSGFVFYWLYSNAVHQGNMGFGAFALFRFSRLYPLHLATLFVLAQLVVAFRALTGVDFIYNNNDAFHFGLNLAVIHYWFLEEGLSWNGPSWSISIEVALYLMFFGVCRLFSPNVLQTICLTLVSLALAHFSPIASGGIAFFAGGLAYYGFRHAQRHRTIAAMAAATLTTILIWRFLGPLTDADIAQRTAESFHNIIPFEPIDGLVRRGFLIFCGRARELALFPSLIFTFAFLESATPKLPWHRLAGIGNISFGVYLLHFPMQVTVMIIALTLSWPSDVFAWPTTFIAFFICLSLGAFVSYRYLERPAMLALRHSKSQSVVQSDNGIDAFVNKEIGILALRHSLFPSGTSVSRFNIRFSSEVMKWRVVQRRFSRSFWSRIDRNIV
jgi:peptidoglycan/LPS O-acetylase OafA/YrhL